MSKLRFLVIALSIILTAAPASAQFSTVIDPPPVSDIFDNFNDGVDRATNFSNTATAGESGGVSSITVPIGAADPQFQFPTPGVIPFDAAARPFLRVYSRGTVGAGSQVFPLPPAGPTVLNYNTTTAFTESQLQFVLPVNGNGLRIDPIGGGTAAVETFDFDYIMLDKFQTVGLAEYDRDGGTEGFDIVGNGHIINVLASAASSSLSGTTAGNDPIMQRTGLSIDTAVFDVLEVRAAFDPLSDSRFEIFWGTDAFPGPVGGQSLVVTDALIRDGDLHTYRFQMSDDNRWSGNLQILRVDPLADVDAVAGRSFRIDYVRLIAGAPVLDSDGDGLPDAIETDTGTFIDSCDTGSDPSDADSDDDSFDDGVEVASGSDPNDADSTPSASLDGYTDSLAVYALGAPIEENLPVLASGNPTGFSVAPDLPDGLQLDALDGTISGTPTTLTAAAVYTITASFAASPDSSFDLSIEVTNPFIAGYGRSPANYRRGDDSGSNNPLLVGAAPNLFSIDPALPGGLNLDPGTGAITGTPSGFQAATEYTITASYDGFPDSQFTLSISIAGTPALVVDPARPISNFVSLGEFGTDGDTEGWGSNNATVSTAGGLLVVNTTAPDPQVFEGGLALDTSAGEHTVLEFRLRQTDNVFVEFFWGDGNGGLSAARRLGIEAVDIPADGDFHIYQIDMSGVFSGAVDIIRLDPGPGAGRTVEFDYIRLGDFTAAEPPRFTDISYDSELDEVTFTWTSTPGEAFVIDVSGDGITWDELDDGFPASPDPAVTTSYLDVDAISFTRRFYRVTRAEP